MCDSEDLLRAGRRRGWHEMRNLSAPTFMSFSPSFPLKQSKTPHSDGSVLGDLVFVADSKRHGAFLFLLP